jgi:DNA-binding IclR family transcriptional regulator
MIAGVENVVAPSGYRERNSTAERALTILDMFSDTQLALSAADIAAELGTSRSTAYRYVQSLVTSGFLEESAPAGFRLGMRILELARLARKGYGLASAALPVMKELSDRFNQTVLLTRRVGTSIICVERSEPDNQHVRLSYERGSQLPINAGASALVLLAWLPEPEAYALLSSQPLNRFTANTLVEPSAIVDRLHQIRSDGFAMTVEEVDPDVIGIAAPVFDGDGNVAVGLSIVAMQNRLPSNERKGAVEAVRQASHELSRILDTVAS